VQRISDSDLEKRQWSGLMELVLKHRRTVDFANYLDKLLPWLKEIEVHNGADFGKIVLRFVSDDLGMGEKVTKIFLQKAEEHLGEQLRGEAMTLADQFRQEGMQQGIEKGEQKAKIEMAKRLLEEKLPLAEQTRSLPLSLMCKKRLLSQLGCRGWGLFSRDVECAGLHIK